MNGAIGVICPNGMYVGWLVGDHLKNRKTEPRNLDFLGGSRFYNKNEYRQVYTRIYREGLGYIGPR